MKKVFSFIIVALLLLTGCNISQDNNKTTKDKATTEENQEDSSSQGDEAGQNDTSEEEETNTEGQSEQEQATTDPFDKGKAKVVLTDYEEAFMKVISYTTNELEQKEYTTKKQLVEHFKHFMSQELAQSIVDTFFLEKDGGLYVIARDGPIFFEEEQPFSFSQTDDTNAIIVQEQSDELIGHVEMEYMLTKKDGIWIVSDINRKQLD